MSDLPEVTTPTAFITPGGDILAYYPPSAFGHYTKNGDLIGEITREQFAILLSGARL